MLPIKLTSNFGKYFIVFTPVINNSYFRDSPNSIYVLVLVILNYDLGF